MPGFGIKHIHTRRRRASFVVLSPAYNVLIREADSHNGGGDGEEGMRLCASLTSSNSGIISDNLSPSSDFYTQVY